MRCLLSHAYTQINELLPQLQQYSADPHYTVDAKLYVPDFSIPARHEDEYENVDDANNCWGSISQLASRSRHGLRQKPGSLLSEHLGMRAFAAGLRLARLGVSPWT